VIEYRASRLLEVDESGQITREQSAQEGGTSKDNLYSPRESFSLKTLVIMRDKKHVGGGGLQDQSRKLGDDSQDRMKRSLSAEKDCEKANNLDDARSRRPGGGFWETVEGQWSECILQ